MLRRHFFVAAAQAPLGIAYGAEASTSSRRTTERTRLSWPDGISVKDAPYNAVGNGVADDTKPIQNAKTAAVAANVPLLFPPGTYKVTDTALTINSTDRLVVLGVPYKSKILNTASASKPTIVLNGAQHWHLQGVVLLGAAGYPNEGIRIQKNSAGVRSAYGHIVDVIAQTNGIGIHAQDNNTIWVTNYGYWVNGGSFLGGTADANGPTNAILADGTGAVNNWNLTNIHVGNLHGIANATSVKWNTRDLSNAIHIVGGELEMADRTVDRAFDFRNCDAISIAHCYLENVNLRFVKCRWVTVENCETGGTFNVSLGDNTQANACSFFHFHELNGDVYSDDAQCGHINHSNCVWQHFTSRAGDSVRLSNATLASAPDHIGYRGFAERGRTLNVGEWATPTFDAGNFTGGDGMTWTVNSSDVLTHAYSMVGKTMTLAFIIAGTSTAGTPSSGLLIRIPGGFRSAKRIFNTFVYKNAGSAQAVGMAESGAAGSQFISLAKLGAANWSLGSNNTEVIGMITFEIQ